MESLVHHIIFWILGVIMAASALGVILAKNTVNSVMSLLVTMLAMAGFYVLMGVTVVALFQVIIYVGAVLVLFLLVTMLLNLREVYTPFPMTPALWTAGIVSLIITCTVGWLLWHAAAQTGLQNGHDIREISFSIHEISLALFSRHLLIFELTSILLLVAAIGAILMAKKTK